MLINEIKLLTSNIGNETVQTVNARELHKVLEVRRDFSNWIKDRIAEYGFVQNVDYVIVQNVCSPNLGSKNGRGGHNKIDYHITVNMAKELAMVERTDKGRAVRRYFIDCEKRAYQEDITLTMKIAELGMQIQSVSNDLSIAGRVLCIGGKTIKPKLLDKLRTLETQLQPQLPLEQSFETL